jgi:hypothetical protein
LIARLEAKQKLVDLDLFHDYLPSGRSLRVFRDAAV